jgi:hypothetical protein
MSTWTTQTTVEGTPEDVLAVLSEPDSCSRWSPIEFRLEDFDGDRLQTGSRARVAGRVAGVSVSFEIDVEHAGDGRLALTARGPMTLDVEYEAYPASAGGADLWATVTVRGVKSISGRLAAAATEALLRGGALTLALSRIAAEVNRRAEELASAADRPARHVVTPVRPRLVAA